LPPCVMLGGGVGRRVRLHRAEGEEEPSVAVDRKKRIKGSLEDPTLEKTGKKQGKRFVRARGEGGNNPSCLLTKTRAVGEAG